VSGRGIGLANVRDRLAILYGDDNRLSLTSSETGGAVARLEIPVRRRGSHAESHSDEHQDPGQAPDRSAVLRVLRTPRAFHHPAVAICAIWLACGLIWTEQSMMFQTVRHRLVDSWFSIARNDMMSAAVWALLTPVVLGLSRRFPIQRPGVAARAAAYIVVGGVVTVAHIATWQRLALPASSFLGREWQSSFVVDFVIYAILVAVGHRRVLATWLRSREADAAALSVELAAARSRAAKLQAIPPVLLQSLDGIARTVRQDPQLTERQLTRLGDYLRLALECTDARGITPERERALESAVAALRDSGAYSLDLTLSA
jgi:hypothetical protein